MDAGTHVTWAKGDTEFEGVVVAIVPPGYLPAEVMFPVAGEARLSGETVVVKGAPVGPPVPPRLYQLAASDVAILPDPE